MASAHWVRNHTGQSVWGEGGELTLARGYYEQEISLKLGQFSGVSSWVICGIINDMKKKAGSVSRGRSRRGGPAQRCSWGTSKCCKEARVKL